MTQPPEKGPEDGPIVPDTGEGAKTREREVDDEAPIESLEVADAAAKDLDEPGRFVGKANAASLASIAPVVDAAWKPRATSAAELAELVERLPETPGVYVMRDRKGVIVYVGKARKLRARVRQYFNGTDTRMF